VVELHFFCGVCEQSQGTSSKDASAQRVETLVAEHRDLVARLGGSSVRGQMGERFVANIFARLQLGEWQDDHGVQDDGFADALWGTDHALVMYCNSSDVADIQQAGEIVRSL